MAARVLAVLAAVAMVLGAVAVRDRMDDRTERRTTTLRLVCSTELAAVCGALAAGTARDVVATVEPAATTADRLSKLPAGVAPDLDGWLVPGPWPQIVADGRRRAGLDAPLGAGPVLARSPVVLAVWKDRAAVLAPRCQNGSPGWKCLGEVAGEPWQPIGGDARWGPVTPGLPPASSAVGLAVRAAATAAWFGRVDLSRADLDDNGYRDWLARLERSQPPDPVVSPLEAMLTRGPGVYDAVGTVEAEAGPLLARSPRPDKPDLLYPSPVATADVVLGASAAPAGRLLADLVSGPAGRRALAAAGWRVPGVAAARGIPAAPPLADGNGLPGRGVLAALRTVVAEVGG